MKPEMIAAQLLMAGDSQYIVVPVPLANLVGLEKAVLLKQIDSWCQHNANKESKEHLKDGHYWTYNSYKDWSKKLPYLGSDRTLQRLFLDLEKAGFIISGVFNTLGCDRRKWYRVDREKLGAAYVSSLPDSDRAKVGLPSSDFGTMGAPEMDDLERAKNGSSITENNNTQTTEKEEGTFSFSGEKSEQQTPISGSADLNTNATQEAEKTPHPPTPLAPASPTREYKHPGKGINDRFNNPERSQNPYFELLGEYELDHLWVGKKRTQFNEWHPAFIQVCKLEKQKLKQPSDRNAVLNYITNLMKQSKLDRTVIGTVQRLAAEAGLYNMATCAAVHKQAMEPQQAIAQPQQTQLPADFQEWWALAQELGKVKSYMVENMPEPSILLASGKHRFYSQIKITFSIADMKAELAQRRNAA